MKKALQSTSIVLSLTIFGVPSFAGGGHDHRADSEIKKDFVKCDKLVSNLSREKNLDKLNECTDFYWHNGDGDGLPGMWNKVIKINYRILELDPEDGDTYTTTAWLLWSNYAAWTKRPSEIPNGEKKADEAIALLRKGRFNLSRDYNYHVVSGRLLSALAFGYYEKALPEVVSYFQRAVVIAKTAQQKSRALVELGHFYNPILKTVYANKQKVNSKEKAIEMYQAALQISKPCGEACVRETLVSEKYIESLSRLN